MKCNTIIRMVATLALAVAMSAEAIPARTHGRRKGTGGGMVLEAPLKGKLVRIVDAQKRIEASTFDAMSKEIAEAVWLKIERVPGGISPTEALADGKAGLVVLIEDRDGAPTLQIAPEAGWATMNVSNLAADNPDKARLEQRVRKELWRALAYSLGAGNERLPSVLSPVGDLAALDALPPIPTPEAFNTMLHSAETRGIGRIRFVSYRRACQEGWAPAPTNDMQKAIWEQVKADKERGPTNPITIQPPGK